MATSLVARARHLILPVSSKAMTSPSGVATAVVWPSLPAPADSLASAEDFQMARPLSRSNLPTDPSGVAA